MPTLRCNGIVVVAAACHVITVSTGVFVLVDYTNTSTGIVHLASSLVDSLYVKIIIL